MIVGGNIDYQPFACTDEWDVIKESSPIKEPEPVINPNLHTPLPSNKKYHIQHEKQQIINRLGAQMSAMNSRIDSLSEVMEDIVSDLSGQYKVFELLKDNIKFLKIGFKANGEMNNHLLNTQPALVDSQPIIQQQEPIGCIALGRVS